MVRTFFLSLFFLSIPSLIQAGVQVYGHRGARTFSPENTLPSYRTALAVGVHWVDMDVALSKEGEVIVTHDLLLNPDIVRTRGGRFLARNKEELKTFSPAQLTAYKQKYTVKNLSLVELLEFDVGRLNPLSSYAQFFPEQVPVDNTTMPTLRQVIRYVKQTARYPIGFQIEMKTAPQEPDISPDVKQFAKAVYRVLIEENILDRAEVQAFDFSCLLALQKIDRRVKTAYLTSTELNEKNIDVASLPRLVDFLGGYAWEPEDRQLTKEALDLAHSLGLKVVVWSWPEKLGTAFDPALTAKMIDWGVDGIITDDPGRLNSMLAARGLKVPSR